MLSPHGDLEKESNVVASWQHGEEEERGVIAIRRDGGRMVFPSGDTGKRSWSPPPCDVHSLVYFLLLQNLSLNIFLKLFRASYLEDSVTILDVDFEIINFDINNDFRMCIISS